MMRLGNRLFAGRFWRKPAPPCVMLVYSGSPVGVCLSGPEEGLVLVRSVWRAEVELMPWEPRFEIAHRQVVPAADLLSHLWMEEGFEPIYRRALTDAGLISTGRQRTCLKEQSAKPDQVRRAEQAQ